MPCFLNCGQESEKRNHTYPYQGVTDESNFRCARVITAKGVTSGVTHLHSLAQRQHSSEETLLRWRAVGDTVSDLTDPRIEPQPSVLIAMS